MPRYAEICSCDVLVCGAGPAGLGAAMAARRMGADVVLLERAALPGGTICAVPWMPVNRLYTDGCQRSRIHQEFIDNLLKFGPASSRPGKVNVIDGDGIHPHPVYAELAIYDMLEAAGVRYRTHSPVSDAIVDGSRVVGAVVCEKRGPVAYRARVCIDATGDGDLAFAAGCAFEQGREEDGLHMPITLGFSLGGVDCDRFFEWYGDEKRPEFLKMLDEADKNGRYVATWYSLNRATVPGIVGVNHGAWRRQPLTSDGLNAADLTAARRNGVHIAADLIQILRENRVLGMESCFIDQLGGILGVRDTRRVVGEYAVTYEDSQQGPAFSDSVARKYGHIDGNQLFVGGMKSGFSYPYRAMLPRGVDGLLVAGRCGSATFLGHCAGKSMGNMMEIGIAAGTAAAMCVQRGETPRQLNIDDLRHALIEEMKVSL
ncbi:MAG: FAD-dependent oxidoreductase [Oscillospiraceae bacterium]